MAVDSAFDAHKVKIASRPSKTCLQFLNTILFVITFNLACLMINTTQFIFLVSLRLLPFAWSRQLYAEGIRYTKGSFGSLLILMSQWFAPTRLAITFEREGKGRFTDQDIAEVVVRNPAGEVVSLNLPNKSIIIANHQVYADWWYVWSLMYFMGTHKDVFIVLKRSLKWLPVVGWGMQFFDFIFLARSWASDRIHLASHLSSLGKQAEQRDKPFSLVLYPEGTLVSKDTRPISKKFAEKIGIPDMTNTLLPRSTGLLYSLRSLALRIPALRLIDVTVVYPGIPPMGYGQDYYTLRSIFCDMVPPPVVNMHLRMFDVAREVPIGDISGNNPAPLDNLAIGVNIPEVEKSDFDFWVRELWRDKDQAISTFLDTGYFTSRVELEKPSVEIPLRLRHKREIFDAFCFFLPAMIGYLFK